MLPFLLFLAADCPAPDVLEKDLAAATARKIVTPFDEARLAQLTGMLGSQEAAYDWLIIAAHSGAEPSQVDAWQLKELRTLAQTVVDLPPGLLKLQKVTSFRRLADGENPYNDASVHAANGAIHFRDTAWKLPVRQFRELVARELARQMPFSIATWTSRAGSGDMVATNTTLANEVFANSAAAYRYTPRLLQAYAPAQYAYLRELLGEPILTHDEDIDRAMAAIGGPLALLTKCASVIQRASKPQGAPQAMLYVVTPQKDGTSAWVSLPRSLFLTRSSCVDEVLARLQSYKLECRHAKNELYIKVADRLEFAWGGFAEAATHIAAASPDKRRDGCMQSGTLTLQCFANTTASESEADRLIKELGPADRSTLAKVLAAQSVVAPTDEQISAKFPWLQDPAALVSTCIAAASEISTAPGARAWKYWFKEKDQLLIYGDPVTSPACKHAFFDALKAHGISMDRDDPLFEHAFFTLRVRAAAAIKLFHAQILDQWEGLRKECAISVASNASVTQMPCTRTWIKTHAQGVVPAQDADAFAKALAPNIRGW